ncbi:hypothetical protein FKP32DRAFT_1682969 [Trametes sanguinea]|nr:hypothetical protein FKP32DRAFT_1682969 [Trametes sanguinea]
MKAKTNISDVHDKSNTRYSRTAAILDNVVKIFLRRASYKVQTSLAVLTFQTRLTVTTSYVGCAASEHLSSGSRAKCHNRVPWQESSSPPTTNSPQWFLNHLCGNLQPPLRRYSSPHASKKNPGLQIFYYLPSDGSLTDAKGAGSKTVKGIKRAMDVRKSTSESSGSKRARTNSERPSSGSGNVSAPLTKDASRSKHRTHTPGDSANSYHPHVAQGTTYLAAPHSVCPHIQPAGHPNDYNFPAASPIPSCSAASGHSLSNAPAHLLDGNAMSSPHGTVPVFGMYGMAEPSPFTFSYGSPSWPQPSAASTQLRSYELANNVANHRLSRPLPPGAHPYSATTQQTGSLTEPTGTHRPGASDPLFYNNDAQRQDDHATSGWTQFPEPVAGHLLLSSSLDAPSVFALGNITHRHGHASATTSDGRRRQGSLSFDVYTPELSPSSESSGHSSSTNSTPTAHVPVTPSSLSPASPLPPDFLHPIGPISPSPTTMGPVLVAPNGLNPSQNGGVSSGAESSPMQLGLEWIARLLDAKLGDEWVARDLQGWHIGL